MSVEQFRAEIAGVWIVCDVSPGDDSVAIAEKTAAAITAHHDIPATGISEGNEVSMIL